MKRDFYVLKYTEYSGYDCHGHIITSISWRTFIEAARECIKLDQEPSNSSEKGVSKFTLPDVSKKKKPFIVY